MYLSRTLQFILKYMRFTPLRCYFCRSLTILAICSWGHMKNHAQEQFKMKCIWAYHVAHDKNDSSYIMQSEMDKIIEVEFRNSHHEFGVLGITKDIGKNIIHTYQLIGQDDFYKREGTDYWLHYIYCHFTEEFEILEWHQHEANNARYLWDEYLYYIRDLTMKPFLSEKIFKRWEVKNKLNFWTEWREIPCSHCNGTGNVQINSHTEHNKSMRICGWCEGNGWIHVSNK